MDDTDEDHDALRRMQALREKLRAAAEVRIEALATMEVPDKPLEIQRQLRTIATADKLIISLFSSPAPPRRARRTEPKPKPPKPEPSPFMKSMDDIESVVKQIVLAQEAMSAIPEMDIPPSLVTALNEVAEMPADAPPGDLAAALARLTREATVASSLHRLKPLVQPATSPP